MDTLLELKTRIITFIEKYETYVKPAAKLLLMLFSYLLVFGFLGFYSRLHVVFIPLILAVLSAVIPTSAGLVLLACYTMLNLYGLGLEVTLVALVLFLLCYLLYFRFAPKKGYLLAMTPVFSFLRIPYTLPVATGLTYSPIENTPVLFGTAIYYFLKAVHENESVFRASGDEATSKITVAVNLFLGNKEMWVALLAFAAANILVYFIRRMSIKNSWRIAIYVGLPLQLIIILIGKMVLGDFSGIVGLIVGIIVSLGLCIVMEFFLFNLDYTRVENVQFEDDRYYYYVKAVPKTMLKAKEKKVTTFKQSSARERQAARQEENEKEQMAKELEIDPKLLK